MGELADESVEVTGPPGPLNRREASRCSSSSTSLLSAIQLPGMANRSVVRDPDLGHMLGVRTGISHQPIAAAHPWWTHGLVRGFRSFHSSKQGIAIPRDNGLD
jgi:hypothetical protein